MSLDERLRAGLEGLDALEGAPPQAVVDAVVGRGRRSRWTRRVVAAAIALTAGLAAIIGTPKALDALRTDGERVPANLGGESGTITTVVGTGAPGMSGDGGPATAAEINYPVDLAFDAEGSLYILELGLDIYGYPVRVRKVDQAGRITTVAGPGARGAAGGLVLGTAWGTTGLAVDTEGNVYLGGGDGPDIDNKVLRVTPSGLVTTIAGTGEPGFSGDGGPATEARLRNVWDVAVDPDGNVYIAGNSRIRKVDARGIITTIVETGTKGLGEWNPTAEAGITGVAVGPFGDIYFIDYGNARIRRIDRRGVVMTIAGNAVGGYSGDGGPATEASLRGPEHLWVDAVGNIFVADTYNRRIRMIDTSGIITTVAGNGSQAFTGDGGPATEAGLSKISGVAVGPDGNLYIADSGHMAVRMVVL
jgi:NHL repeat